MTTQAQAHPDSIAAELLRLDPGYAATPLIDLPGLAAQLGVAQVLAKDEGHRLLGSFKSLGGTYAGLRALARFTGRDITALVTERPGGQPVLVCASDGNHGLAVALAARLAGAPARVFLHAGVPAARARRIGDQSAEIVWIDGTYDDAVDAAAEAARAGSCILVADTTDDPDDPVVHDVMAGYGVMAAEIRSQAIGAGYAPPTHLFVQAGVGGLAAAMADGLVGFLAPPALIVAVEPASAACLRAAMAADRPIRIPGDLHTEAEMLSCGEASAPALVVLKRHGAQVVTVTETELAAAPAIVTAHGGPATTPSGAASLAGVLAALSDPELTAALKLGTGSRLLVLITEGALGD